MQYTYCILMSKDTRDTEAAWKAAQASYVTEVKDGKANVKKMPIRPQGNGIKSKNDFVGTLESTNAISMLMAICEEPGQTKSAYSGSTRSA